MKKITKSRSAQMILQSFYCAFALVAFFGSVGFYDMKFVADFYVYFTNICNYLCAGIMLAELIQTVRKQEDGYVTVTPRLRAVSMLGLVATLIIFNALLAKDPARAPALNYKVECILYHIVLPILYIADWAMFYEHGKISWKLLLLLSVLLPFAYLAYVFIHAAFWHVFNRVMNYTGTDPVIYPYFFLDPGRVGVSGMITWILAMLVGFMGLGYLFMLFDRALGRKKDA